MQTKVNVELKKVTRDKNSNLTRFGIYLNTIEDVEIKKLYKKTILENRIIWPASKDMKTRKHSMKNWRYRGMGAPDTITMSVIFCITKRFFSDTSLIELFDIADEFDREFITELSEYLKKIKCHATS
jgi:hypothetical protein